MKQEVVWGGSPELSRFKALRGKVEDKSDIFSPEGSGSCVGKGGHQGTMTGGPHSVWGDEEKQGIREFSGQSLG